MKKIEYRSNGRIVLETFLTIVFAMILWPLFDLVIKGDKFEYNVFDYIVQPIIFGLIVGIVIWIMNARNKKKKENE